MSLITTANRISLRGRVIGGFGLLILLIAGMSIFNDGSVREVQENVTRIDAAAAASDTAVDFSRNLLILRRVIINYVRSGSATDRATSLAAFEPVNQTLEKLAGAVGARSDILRSGFAAYRKDFDLLDGELKKRQGALSAVNAAGVRLTNTMATVTTELDAAGERVLPVYYSDNSVTLLPGEARTIEVRCPVAGKSCARVGLRGWNVRMGGIAVR